MALFVFGAGATRGASFVAKKLDPCLPPLDNDFFTQLQRVQNKKHYKLIKEVMADVVELFGYNFNVTMETVFTTLEHTIKMIEVTGENRSFTRAALIKKRNRLVQALARVFEDSISTKDEDGRSKLDPKSCEYHNTFVKKVLKNKDALISFNYDCVLDESLKNYGDAKWNPRYGYGFNLGSRGVRLSGDSFWMPKKCAKRDDTVKYYKLHGSLHFDIENPDDAETNIKLKERPYTTQYGNLHFTIIPPEFHKAYSQGVFASLWSKAASAIQKSKSLIFIGYSMPPTDVHSTALFRTSIKKEALSSLIVVNPDKTARRRIRDAVQRGLNKHTKVLSFDYLHEFISLDTNVWRT